MTRRAFLWLLSAGATGFALDPERLLWVPGQKTIFIPKAAGCQFVSEEYILRKMLEILERHGGFSTDINRAYDQQFVEVAA